MKKRYITVFGILVVSVVAYLIISMVHLNEKEIYYGKIQSEDGIVKKLVSEDGHIKHHYKLTTMNIDKVDPDQFVKVTLTDAGGVILDESLISKSQIPKKLKNKF